MRYDGFGMFWEDTPTSKILRDNRNRPMPKIPDTGWTAPTEFPRLEAAKVLSIDTETYDPNIETNGPGWPTGDGHVVGISVGTEDGHNWYFPMRHEVGGGNLDPDSVLRWARDELCRESQAKIGANLQYDIGWLRHEGVNVKGRLIDVQFAEALLDEHRFSYALGNIATDYLGESKIDEDLYAWCALAYGGKVGRKQAGNIYRAPVALVGPYAESDADLPMKIWAMQKKRLIDENLQDLFDMECALIYMLVDMRTKGVRVDVEGAGRVFDALLDKEKSIVKKLGGINVDSGNDLKRVFDKAGHSYPTTAKGNPSFTKPFLESCTHELAHNILDKRRLTKARNTFVKGYILDKAHKGRVHGEFHPLRSDDGGTVSGRFSSSHPNLQNIPARDPEMKLLIRGLFLPEIGEEWVSADYSQIEYRLMVHAARGPGAEEARLKYSEDPNTDYHAMTQALIKNLLNREVDRGPVKNINFGKIFGMGKATLKRQLVGLTDYEAEMFFDAYDTAVPYARSTAEAATKVAKKRGYIKTILGRRARFPYWESAMWGDPDNFLTRDKSKAEDVFRHVQRASTHKALNCYTQGSCADIMKKAMLDIYKAGLPVPLLTVHDENDWSLPIGDTQVLDELVSVMQDAVKLKVPIIAETEKGTNWGNIK